MKLFKYFVYLFVIIVGFIFLRTKVKDGELLKGITEQASSVANVVGAYGKSGWSNLSSLWNQQSSYQQPCEQSNLLHSSEGSGYSADSGNSYQDSYQDMPDSSINRSSK